MAYPKAIEELIAAQNNLDSAAFAACFNESGRMLEEGKWYTGRTEIREVIEHANEKYRSFMKPVSLTGPEAAPVLAAEVSGTFPGSPAILHFHFELADGGIQSLKVTG